MGHGHGHGHGAAVGHAGGRHRWRLAVTFAMVAAFLVVELVAGLWSGSLALISDAGHMTADVVALGAALIATRIATRADTTGRRTYGSYRVEVFASGLTVLVMLGVAVYVVLEGRVSMSTDGGPAGSLLQAILSAGDLFGELSALDPGPRATTGRAMVPSVVACLRREDLIRWAAGRPAVAEQMFRVLARRLRRTNDSLADLIFTDVPGRVAKNLLQMAGRFGTRDGGVLRVTHDLTQEEIAQLVGASRETVNKALADFASRGWLRLDGKSIIILDPERLARRARV